MEKFLRPERCDTNPANSDPERRWLHWKQTFLNFLGSILETTGESKWQLLVNYVASNIYQYISETKKYSDAISILDSLHIKQRNEKFTRHCFASRNQQAGESDHEYLQVLKQMSKYCNFKAASAELHENEYTKDTSIHGLRRLRIRHRLLENTTITLEAAFDQARALELAELHSASYVSIKPYNYCCHTET
jgi:hypothetical protein